MLHDCCIPIIVKGIQRLCFKKITTYMGCVAGVRMHSLYIQGFSNTLTILTNMVNYFFLRSVKTLY